MIRLNDLYKMYGLANTRYSPVVRIFDYLVDPALCIVKCLDKYLIRAKNWRDLGKTQLLVCYTFPHSAMTRSIISGWIKIDLKLPGLSDVLEYEKRSTRGVII